MEAFSSASQGLPRNNAWSRAHTHTHTGEMEVSTSVIFPVVQFFLSKALMTPTNGRLILTFHNFETPSQASEKKLYLAKAKVQLEVSRLREMTGNKRWSEEKKERGTSLISARMVRVLRGSVRDGDRKTFLCSDFKSHGRLPLADWGRNQRCQLPVDSYERRVRKKTRSWNV